MRFQEPQQFITHNYCCYYYDYYNNNYYYYYYSSTYPNEEHSDPLGD